MTNQYSTFKVLDSRYLTKAHKLDMNSMNTDICLYVREVMLNNQDTYEYVLNKRIKSHAIVWIALTRIIERDLPNDLTCDSRQIKNYFQRHGLDYKDALKDTVQAIRDLRNAVRKDVKAHGCTF